MNKVNVRDLDLMESYVLYYIRDYKTGKYIIVRVVEDGYFKIPQEPFDNEDDARQECIRMNRARGYSKDEVLKAICKSMDL